MAEPQVMNPRPARAANARFAPWHIPTSSAWTTTSLASAGWPRCRASPATDISADALLGELDHTGRVSLGDEAGAGRIIGQRLDLVALEEVEHHDRHVTHQI